MEEVATILKGIEKGTTALPDFQRGFEWSEQEIIELLVTVVNDWPAGSLLLMPKPKHPLFPVREVELGPELKTYETLVLDGQQRLTSLYYACYDVDPGTTYAIVLKELADGGDPEQCVQAFKRAEWEKNCPKPVDQYANGLVPFSVVLDATNFFRWRDSVLDALLSGDRELARDELTDLHGSHLRNVERYRFPVVLLDANLPATGVARIFERVNRTGRRLTTWDLMVAKLFREDWNLRIQWDNATAEAPQLLALCPRDGLPILQAMALRYSSDVRQSAVLDLSPQLVHDQWSEFVSGMEEAGQFFETQGVPKGDDLPYGVLRTIICALAVSDDLSKSYGFLEEWFWGRIFSAHFDSAANTKGVADYRMLAEINKADDLPPAAASELKLMQATRRSSRALWHGIQALVRREMRRANLNVGDDEFVPFSLLDGPERHKAEALETPYHQRVLGVVLGPRSLAVDTKRSGFLPALEAFQQHAVMDVPGWISTNGLGPDLLDALDRKRPDEALRERLDWLTAAVASRHLQFEN